MPFFGGAVNPLDIDQTRASMQAVDLVQMWFLLFKLFFY